MLDRRIVLRRPRILSAAPSFWRGIFSSWHPGDSHSVPLIATTAATGRGGGQRSWRRRCAKNVAQFPAVPDIAKWKTYDPK